MGGRVISQDFLNLRGQGEIHIIPVAVGAKFVGDLFKGAFNLAKDAVDFVVDNAIPLVTAFITGGSSLLLTTAALSVASDLLTPDVPTQNFSSVGDTDPSIRGSYSFSGIQNVSNAGVPVPIIYGLVFTGSIIISSGVDTAQVKQSLS